MRARVCVCVCARDCICVFMSVFTRVCARVFVCVSFYGSVWCILLVLVSLIKAIREHADR